MTTITFDTLKFVETLRASGFDDTQAKGMANALREVRQQEVADVVSKQELKAMTEDWVAKINADKVIVTSDIKALEVKMEAGFAAVDSRFAAMDAKMEARFAAVDGKFVEVKRDMKELELRMTIKLGAMLLASIGILFGLMRVWPLPVQFVAHGGYEVQQPVVPPVVGK